MSTVWGQMKEVKFSEKSSAGESWIRTPDFKLGLLPTSTRGENRVFVPKTIAYEAGEIAVSLYDGNRPLLIEGLIPSDGSRGLSPVDQALNYLTQAQPLMRIASAEEEWSLMSHQVDDKGNHHIKFSQRYKGVPVYGSEVIVHGSKKGMNSLNGRFYTTPEVDVVPSLSAIAVKQSVVSDLGSLVSLKDDRFQLFGVKPIEEKLVVFPIEDGFKLAYHVTAYKNIVERWEYIVDAHDGSVLQKHESICRFHNHKMGEICAAEGAVMPPIVSSSQDLFGNNQSINTFQSGSDFFMIDAVRSEMFDAANSKMPNEPVGTIWTLDAFNTSPQKDDFSYDHVKSISQNFPNKREGVSAHINAGKAYEYFLKTHGRVSINGEGGNMISLVNVADEDGSGLDNAFWNGIAMFYGNGKEAFNPLARGLDVAGHEMTHGVVQSTANLQYQGESGALNESFADVFGAMIDRDDWVVGEDVVKRSAFPSGALRSLEDPHNGARQGNFNAGWQPKFYSERYTGSEDNGGVHINSGIPNYVYYLFATASGVGKDKAEKVYYKALTENLTASSQFVDARVATVKAAQDLYGGAVVTAINNAWDAVGVKGSGNDYEVDEEVNPGSDFVVFTTVGTSGQNNIYISDGTGKVIFNPASEKNPKSKPSVTDNGREILYVTDDGQLGYLFINWQTQKVERDIIIESDGGWRNAVFSKDGLRLAALKDTPKPEIFVYDFESQSGTTYTLYNPTYTQGTETGDVKYADAMEFDLTGEYILYDAYNEIKGQTGGDINYWDIGLIKVWNNAASTFVTEGQIQKIFSALPKGISVGNPTFSKNSPYIIAFDQVEGSKYTIRAANIEKNKLGVIFENSDRLGYPSFSRTDDRIIFDAKATSGQAVIGQVGLAEDKINATGSATLFLGDENVGIRWGTWFGNGTRIISDVDDEELLDIRIYPNPTTDKINIEMPHEFGTDYIVSLSNVLGQELMQKENATSLDVSTLQSGSYILSIVSEGKTQSTVITKQ